MLGELLGLVCVLHEHDRLEVLDNVASAVADDAAELAALARGYAPAMSSGISNATCWTMAGRPFVLLTRQ